MQSPSEKASVFIISVLRLTYLIVNQSSSRNLEPDDGSDNELKWRSVSGDETRGLRGDRKAAIFNPHHTNHLLIMPKPLSITFLGNFNRIMQDWWLTYYAGTCSGGGPTLGRACSSLSLNLESTSWRKLCKCIHISVLMPFFLYEICLSLCQRSCGLRWGNTSSITQGLGA